MSSPRGKNVKGRSKAYYNRIAQRALALRNASSGGRTYHTHHCQHQGYDDKEDESLGMRTGAEDTKKQTFKDRRDESYGKWGTRGGRGGRLDGPGTCYFGHDCDLDDREVDVADVSLAYCYGRKRKYMNFKPYYGHSWRSHNSGECINIPE